MLELGIKAPDFELPDQNGEVHKLSDYAGKKVILYFYPKPRKSVRYARIHRATLSFTQKITRIELRKMSEKKNL